MSAISPYNSYNSLNGHYYQRNNQLYNELKPNGPYIGYPQSNECQYTTYYLPRNNNLNEDYLQALEQQMALDKEKKIKAQSYDESKRSHSVYTYPYHYSNEYSYSSLQQKEMKKKQEYNLYLKQQIEEKQMRKALEDKRRLEEKMRDEEKYMFYNQSEFNSGKTALPNYHKPANDGTINKMSFTGMSIVETQANSLNNNSNGFNRNNQMVFNQYSNKTSYMPAEKIYSNGIEVDIMSSSLISNNVGDINKDILANRTQRLPPCYLVDNCVNDLIMSRDSNEKYINHLPAYIANIDLNALKYRSKYENNENEHNPIKNNQAAEINSFPLIDKNDTGLQCYNSENKNRIDRLKMSMKGDSTLVQADDNKGTEVANGFLKTWKKEDSIKNCNPVKNDRSISLTQNEVDDYNNKPNNDKLSNNNIKHYNKIQVKPLLPQTDRAYKDSKSYYQSKEPSYGKIIKKRSNLTVLNNIHANHINNNYNSNYNPVSFNKNVPSSISKEISYDVPDINNYIPKINLETSDLTHNNASKVYNAYNYKINNAKNEPNYPLGITNNINTAQTTYTANSNNNAYQNNTNRNNVKDSNMAGDNEYLKNNNDIYSFKESSTSAVNDLKKNLSINKSIELNKENSESIPYRDAVFPSKKNNDNNDDLCNVRYSDSDSNKDNNNFLSKSQKSNEEVNETNNKAEISVTCGFLDDDEIDTQKAKVDKDNPEKKDNKRDSGKFQCQLNFFDQTEYDSFSIKKSKLHKVIPGDIPHGNYDRSKQYSNSNNPRNALVTTIKDVNPNIPSYQASSYESNAKGIVDSIFIQDSFADKLIKDMGNFQLNNNANFSLESNPLPTSSPGHSLNN